jgi:hypothetical protein
MPFALCHRKRAMNENWPGAFAPSQRYIEPSKRPMRAMRYLILHLPGSLSA